MTDSYAPTATVVCLADVPPEHVSYLWADRLPLGKMVVFDGDPSVGKSTLTNDLAARVTTGSTWPDGAPGGAPCAVVIMSAEDGLADTISPRLHAAGADLTRVHAITEILIWDDEGRPHRRPPSLPADIGLVEQTITRTGAKLLVIDVLMAYLSGKVDSHRDQDVRSVLHQVAAMAERTGCCVILVRHMNKSGGTSPLYRGSGSIGIVGAARAAYIIGRDPQDPELRIMAVSKMNLAAEPPSLGYRLVNDETYGCASVVWEGVVGHSAADLLRGPGEDDEGSERDQAATWLADHLTDQGGEARAADVLKAANAVGFSRDSVKRAKARAGVVSRKSGMDVGWLWVLDIGEGSAKGAKGAGHLSLLPSLPSHDPTLPSQEVAP